MFSSLPTGKRIERCVYLRVIYRNDNKYRETIVANIALWAARRITSNRSPSAGAARAEDSIHIAVSGGLVPSTALEFRILNRAV